MRRQIIAGNWKMYKTIAEAKAFVEELPVMDGNVEVVLCAPFTVLSELAKVLPEKNIALGAQNVHWAEEGAFTGEISPSMLKEIGVQYVIIGHSERRAYFNETDETVNQRVHAALQAGLTPIVCVGENVEEHDSGLTKDVVKRQIVSAMNDIQSKQMEKLVVAYEPIWAIGTGKTSTAEDANEVIQTIRGFIADQFDQQVANSVSIQYGGSVKPDNITGFLSQSDIDGALVGGASLQPEAFIALVKGAKA